MSLVSLTCKNRSYVQTHTCTAEGSLPDRGQPLSWREREGGREGGREKRGEAGDSLVVYRESGGVIRGVV